MFDNKDSYSAKEYSRNKDIYRLIKIIIIFGYFIIASIYTYSILINARSPFGLVFMSTLVYFALKVIDWLKKQNVNDRKRNYSTWGRGAGAEGVVGNQLMKLGPEYKIISDFQNGHKNIDFIVIGPKGIFTIEVKAHKGVISYKDDWIWINNLKDAHDMIGQTRAEMFWLTNYLKNNQFDLPVTGILEFPYGDIDMSSIHGQIDGIWIGGSKFHEYIISRSQNNLSIEQINLIVDSLNRFTPIKK
jgi:hypothetical protein